jgi:hypothetical protein
MNYKFFPLPKKKFSGIFPMFFKDELVRFLAGKYDGDVTRLANAWEYHDFYL